MTTYIPASDAVRSNYAQFKQHLMMYTGILTNFDEYNRDATTMCNNHKMDDEIKTSIIEVVTRNTTVPLLDVLGVNHVPTDTQLDRNVRFTSNVYHTWSYFTFVALKYFERMNELSDQFIETNIAKIRWDNECLTLICKKKYNIETIKKILNASGLPLTSSTLIAAYGKHDIELIELHNMPVTPECIIAASTYNNKDTFFTNLMKQQPLTTDTLSLMIQIKHYAHDTFEDILKHVSPTQEHVKLACTHHRVDLIPMLLNYRLSVDAECFELMFFTGIDNFTHIIPECIEQFLLAGYQLTYQDVVRLARRRFYVRDISRFNFTFDNELTEACILNYFNSYMDILPYTIESLRLACQVNSHGFIQCIIEKGIIPDRQCLINALHNTHTIQLVLPHIRSVDAELAYQLKQRGYSNFATIKY